MIEPSPEKNYNLFSKVADNIFYPLAIRLGLIKEHPLEMLAREILPLIKKSKSEGERELIRSLGRNLVVNYYVKTALKTSPEERRRSIEVCTNLSIRYRDMFHQTGDVKFQNSAQVSSWIVEKLRQESP